MITSVETLAVSVSDLYAGGYFVGAGDKLSAYAAKAIAIAGNWLRIHYGVPGPDTRRLNYVGAPNSQYLVRFAINLTGSPWFTLATNTVAPDGRGTVLDSTATNGQGLYCIITP